MNVRGIEKEETSEGLTIYLDTNQHVHYIYIYKLSIDSLRVQQVNANTCKCRCKDKHLFKKVDEKLGAIPEASKKNSASPSICIYCLPRITMEACPWRSFNKLSSFWQRAQRQVWHSGFIQSCLSCWSLGAFCSIVGYICMVSCLTAQIGPCRPYCPWWYKSNVRIPKRRIGSPFWGYLCKSPDGKDDSKGWKKRCNVQRQTAHRWPFQAK